MTSQSAYHYVESSSRLLDDDADDESLNEPTADTSISHKNVSFFQNDDSKLEQDLADNKVLRETRHRKLSHSRDASEKATPTDSVGGLPNNAEFAEARKKRRTNSFNDVKLPKFHYDKHSHDMIDIKSSLKKAINAGKQIIPSTVEFAKKLEHSISVQSHKKPSVHDAPDQAFRYNRSESYNQNPEFDAEHELFSEQELSSQFRDSKNNFLPSETASSSNFRNTPTCLVEEEASISSTSTSPSSSASKNRSIIEEETEGSSVLLEDRRKILFDQNNNLLDGNCELIRLEHLKLTRHNSDSIRMRHNSSKGQLVRKASLKLEKKFLNSNNPLIDSQNCMLVANLDSPTGSSDDGQVTFSPKRNRRQEGCFTKYFVITLLFVVNLLNYIDRYSLAGN